MADNGPMDPAADAYLRALVARVAETLGDRLVGVYLVNSGARGDYLPGRSDLDVAVLTDGRLEPRVGKRVVARLRHRSLPCPAPRLELVVYQRAVAAAPGARPAFELNLNSGPAIADHATFDPAQEPAHWFLLDLAAASQRALRLAGPPTDGLFAAPPRTAVIEALRASRAWHTAHDPATPNRVLNDCRAWMWVETGRWASKSEAAAWAIGAGGDRVLIGRAAARRRGVGDEPLPSRLVERFSAVVGGHLERAARQRFA